VIEWPNGAKVYTGHLKDQDAYAAFQGWGVQRLLLEEAGQIPREEDYMKLISSVRSTNSIKPQVFLTCNPGGPGHAWLQRRFKIGDKPSNKAFKDPVSGRWRIYCPATIFDNPKLMEADPDYVNYLKSLPSPLKEAWLEGRWDIFAGQYFKEWDPGYHIMSEEEARKIGYGEEHNTKFIGVDWGFAQPHAAVFVECTEKGRVFVFDELYGKEMHPIEVGERIAKKCQGHNITQTLIDPSAYIRNPMSWRQEHSPMHSDASIAHAMQGPADNPLVPNMMPANNDRVNGWRNMAQLMKVEEGKPPNFVIIRGAAPNLAQCIPEMVCDEKRPEDLDTTNNLDHLPDACRYALSHVQAPAEIENKKSKDQLKYEQLLNPTPQSWNYDWKD
jgi:phage terminase large subunit